MFNFFKKITNKIKGLHKSRLINPHIYWIILVQFFLWMSFFLIIFSFYLLYKIRNEQLFQVSPTYSENPPSLINEKLLERVTDSLEKKEIKNKEIESGVYSFSDPS
jgi:hypothetical protein